MKIILFGKNGQLGRELQPVLAPFGEVTAVDYQEIDLRDASRAALETFIRLQKPQAIVNASAYTAVDRAEQEQELAFQVNSRAPGLMANLARELNSAFIHVSTDYVFYGTLGRPYVETDTPNPLNVYGKSKLAGEQAIQKVGGAYLILRTSWVYSMGADSFVTKILGWARKNPELRVVDDQVGNPTWARPLAEMIGRLLTKAGDTPFAFFEKNTGVYHLAGDGYASCLEWARKILALDPHREEQICKEIRPALTSDFPTPARRPLFSALNCDHFAAFFTLRVLRGLSLPPWKAALRMEMERSG